MVGLPQEYSTFLSFVQTEARDDFLPANVLIVCPEFEAFQSPEKHIIIS